MFRRLLIRWLPTFTALTFLLISQAHSTEVKPRILMISPEQRGIYQTGGLAHATADLTSSLVSEGYQVEVMMPFYLEMGAKEAQETGERFSVNLYRVPGYSHKKSQFSVLRYQNASNPTIFIRHDNAVGEANLFDNRTNPEVGKNYTYAPEPIEAFGILAHAQAQFILSQNYDIVFLNDWSAGIIALHLHLAKQQGIKVPKVIFAIHNIAYQGVFPRSLTTYLGLDPQLFSRHAANFYGQSFLKTGIQYSDMVYTVSPQYSREISTPRFGAGLDGLVRAKTQENRLTGILNGIVNSQWDPTIHQEGLAYAFSEKDLSGKAKGKEQLQKTLGLPIQADVPLFVLTSRLAEQKGFAYLVGAIEEMAQKSKAQWVIVGDGEMPIIEKLKSLQSRFQDRIHYSKFSNLMEKQLMRYGDFFVNGAWFEPSGLNQFFALKNGTIPVVSRTGGLLDSVKDGVTGLTFPIVPSPDGKGYDVELTKQSVIQAFQRTIQLYRTPEFEKMRLQAMREDHSWNHRIRQSFGPLFQFVLENGYEKGPFQAKPQLALPGTRSQIRACSRIHLNGGF